MKYSDDKKSASFILSLLFSSLSALYLITYNLEVLAGDAVEIFNLGIASADPTQDGIVIWTRINPNIHNKLNKDLILEISQSPEMRESSVIKNTWR